MTTTKKARTTQNDKAYEGFLQSLELVSLALRSCSSQLNRDAYFDITFGKNRKALRSLRDTYSVTSFDETYFEAEGRFALTVSSGTDDPPVLMIEFVYEIHMHGKPPLSKEMADRFTKSELRLILIPFARQFISTLSAQMAIPPVLIPLAAGGK